MNVLMVSDCGVKYGASKSFRRLIYNISRIDENIRMFVLLSSDARVVADELTGYGCKVIIAPYYQYMQDTPYSKSLIIPKLIIRGVKYIFGRITGTAIATRELDLSKMDLIYSNSIREDIGALLSRKYNIPHIWHIREFGELDFNSYSYRFNYIDFINKYSTRCLTVSESVRLYWIKKGLSSELAYTVYNGVSNIDEYRLTSHKMVYERIRIVMVGSLIETKGHFEMIEAIRRLPPSAKEKITVDIFGDGRKRYVDEIKKRVIKYGLSDVINLRGYCYDISSELVNYDIGLNCSRAEAFGRVTVEYMMAGLMVIASDTGANGEIIENESNGILYKQGSPEALSNAIQRVIDNPNLILECASQGRKTATAKFDEKINAQNVIRQFYDVLKIKA